MSFNNQSNINIVKGNIYISFIDYYNNYINIGEFYNNNKKFNLITAFYQFNDKFRSTPCKNIDQKMVTYGLISNYQYILIKIQKYPPTKPINLNIHTPIEEFNIQLSIEVI